SLKSLFTGEVTEITEENRKMAYHEGHEGSRRIWKIFSFESPVSSMEKFLLACSARSDSDCPLGGGGDESCVLGENASRILWRGSFPLCHAAGNLRVGDFNFELAYFGVDGDAVAFAYGGDRPAQRGFRRNVSDHEAARRATESSVSDQRHGFAQA